MKQVKSVYPDLDLSTITMGEPTPLTPAGDIVNEECDVTNNLKANQNNDSVVLAQPAVGKSTTIVLKTLLLLVSSLLLLRVTGCLKTFKHFSSFL